MNEYVFSVKTYEGGIYPVSMTTDGFAMNDEYYAYNEVLKYLHYGIWQIVEV